LIPGQAKQEMPETPQKSNTIAEEEHKKTRREEGFPSFFPPENHAPLR
jgi:hypothetical protein